jgi:hypothetical protein
MVRPSLVALVFLTACGPPARPATRSEHLVALARADLAREYYGSAERLAEAALSLDPDNRL